jgi:flagellar biogenesis protein FliO
MASASTFWLLARLVLSLTVVIGLMVGLTTVLRRKGFGGLAPSKTRRSLRGAEVEVLVRKPLTRSASIAVVRAGNKSMVLGITDTTVTMLTETELEEVDIELDDPGVPRTGLPIDLEGSNPTWKTMLENLRDKTVRRT